MKHRSPAVDDEFATSRQHRPASSVVHFAAGLGSDICSAVLLQPADLLKTRVQESKASTLRASVRSIISEPHAIRSFWRGTLPSAIRTGFGSALYFTSLNALRRTVVGSNFRAGLNEKEILSAARSSSLPKLNNTGNLATGALARVAAGFAIMPMTVIKVRYESTTYAYQSIASAGRAIYKAEGLRAFFSGAGATAFRDAPYAGIYLLFYEQLKQRVSSISERFGSVSEMDGGRSAAINFASGATAAGLSTALTNPFDVLKTRLQLRPREYRNMFYAIRKLTKEDGMKCLFDGMALRMGRKVLSSALAWTLYEELMRRAKRSFAGETKLL